MVAEPNGPDPVNGTFTQPGRSPGTVSSTVVSAPVGAAPAAAGALAPSGARFVLPAFFASLVGTVTVSYLTPLLGDIATRFQVSASDVAWVSVVLSLSAVASLAVFPRLGDRYGHRLVVSGVLALIAAGGVVAATTNSFAVLLAGLALQATGGCLASLGAGLIRRVMTGARLGRGLGLLNLAAGVGNGIGFLLGGLVLAVSTLHTLFWLIAGTALVLLAVVNVLTPGGHRRRSGALNLLGTLLLMGWLVAAILGLARGDTWGWTGAPTLGCLAAAAVLFAAWLVHEWRTTAPVIDLRFVRRGVNGLSMLLICVAGVCTSIIATMVVISQSLPAPFGAGAEGLTIALLLLVNGIGIAVVAPIVGAWTPRIGSRPIAAAGMVLLTAAGLVLAFGHSARPGVVLGILLLGLATGAVWSTLLVGLVERAGDDAGAVGGSLQDISIQVGFALAGPVNIVVLALRTVPGADGPVPADIDFTTGFLVAAGLAAIGTALSLLLRGDRAATSGPAPGPHRPHPGEARP